MIFYDINKIDNDYYLDFTKTKKAFFNRKAFLLLISFLEREDPNPSRPKRLDDRACVLFNLKTA
jgi:hypothetical protein